jgi:hypothetical protein
LASAKGALENNGNILRGRCVLVIEVAVELDEAEVERVIAEQFRLLAPTMDERATRLWAAAWARTLGHGGGAVVERATGIRGKRIWNGKRDLEELEEDPPDDLPQDQRVRRPGAGRKRLTEVDESLVGDLESLVDPVTRGDPESSLRWTSKSTYKLAEELRAMGHSISPQTVGELLKQLDYRLQANKKALEGSEHPDRNAQFEYINARAEEFLAHDLPVLSVDTKKKELIGDFANGGREWQPKGEPVEVRTHDFIDRELGKAIPYGVYDVGRNEAFVNVGIDSDTAEFAVNGIAGWWSTMGRRKYPDAGEVLVTPDSGGSNAARSRLWKVALQRFADRTGLAITVCHFPPGTSKWNKIEHRLFSQITMNWRGRPLLSHQTVVQLIGGTRTTTGLTVRARLDTRSYPTGTKISDAEMQNLNVVPHKFHGDWNYTVLPREA